MIIKRNRLIGVFCCLLITVSEWAHAENYILVLNSISREDTWTEHFNLELKRRFNQQGDINLEIYTLPAPFETKTEDVPKLQKQLLEKYANSPLAVVVVGDPAWMVYAPLFSNEWKDIPVVLCYSRSRIPSSLDILFNKVPLTEENSIPIEEFNKPYKVTVLKNPLFLMENINLIRRMQPQMQKLVFISDSRYISASIRTELLNLMRKHYSDLELELLTENEISTEQLMDRLHSYGPADGILFYSWVKPVKEENPSYIDRHFNHTLFAAAQTPIFTVHDINPVSSGFVGGYYISVEDFAESCVAVLDKLLAGKPVTSIPPSSGGVPRAYLNYSTLQWLDIPSDLYPSDASYYNRPSHFFERNRWLIYILLFLSGLFFIMKYIFRQRNKKRNVLNRYLLRMLDSPVYMLDKNGNILEELNDLHRSYDVLKQRNESGFSFKKLFVDEKEYVRYIRLINFVIWTGKVREKIIRLRESSDEVRYLFTRIVRCDQERVLVMISDISEKEKNRRESEEYRFFLKTILENLPISVFVKDMKVGGRFTVWNKRLSEVLGIPASDIKGTGSEALPKHIRQITDFENGGDIPSDKATPVPLLRELEWTDGHKKVLSVFHSLISYRDQKCWLVGSVIDITEQETRKKELEKLNRRYDLMLRAMGAMPWTWNLQTGRLECDRNYIPEKFHFTKGIVYKTEEEHYSQIVSEHRERFRSAVHRLCSGEIMLMNETYQIYYPESDEPLWVESCVVVGQRNAVGYPLELVGTTIIVDERKKMEKELLYSKEKAEEANQMKSAFLANMTHEIRTPLSAITGFSSLLAASSNTPENQEYIQIIENNSRILLKLVNDVLDMSKIESGTLELVYNNVNVNASLADLVSSWRMRITPEVTICFEPAMDYCILRTDEVRLLQIMGNYISNAVKYTEKGTITLGYDRPVGNSIRFYVRDTGSGIPVDKLSTVFERFVKLDSFKQGTGLGLSICKMIAERMDGRVGAISEEGQGSEFWFEHPYNPVS